MYTNETRNAYTALVRETRQAFSNIDKRGLSLSMAVPFSPEPLGCITGRCKHWADMAKYLDVVFVMGYDSQIDIITASASAPLNRIEEGLKSYIALGIAKQKLVLGVPWYRFVPYSYRGILLLAYSL